MSGSCSSNLLRVRAETHRWPNLTLGTGSEEETLVSTSGERFKGRRNLARAAEDREDGLTADESGFSSHRFRAAERDLVLVAEGPVDRMLLIAVADRVHTILGA